MGAAWEFSPARQTPFLLPCFLPPQTQKSV
jgi:hypothetical protein